MLSDALRFENYGFRRILLLCIFKSTVDILELAIIFVSAISAILICNNHVFGISTYYYI